MPDWFFAVATGAVGAAIVKLIDNVVMLKLNRKIVAQDKENKLLKSLVESQRVILLDRIQYLCRAYIAQGWVDFDDRRRLHKMHDAYHALGGNGDLDILMAAVDELPVK